MSQVLKKIIRNRIIFISSICFLSLVLSVFIHSTWAAVWKGPTAPPPDENVNPPIYNDALSNNDTVATINRQFVTFTGGIISQTLKSCGKVYSDIDGNFLCGTDETGSGIIDINTQTTGSLPYTRISGTPPALTCDWSGIRNVCGDGYTITCTGGLVTRIVLATPNQSTNPAAACFVPACL